MFGATLEGEYLAVAESLGLTEPEVAQLAKNGVLASFLPDDRKTALLTEIDAVTA
jgi:aminodeoxyfutalosine deaminase